MFDKYLLMLEELDTMTKPYELRFDKVSFWVYFYNLPLGCRNRNMETRLQNTIGIFEDVDCNRGTFCHGGSLRIQFVMIFRKP